MLYIVKIKTDPLTMYCLVQAQMSNSTVEFFLNGAESSFNSVNSANSGNLINQSSMNWAEFKDPLSHVCLAGDVVASWSLTQEMAGLSPFTIITNIFEFAEFSEIV